LSNLYPTVAIKFIPAFRHTLMLKWFVSVARSAGFDYIETMDELLLKLSLLVDAINNNTIAINRLLLNGNLDELSEPEEDEPPKTYLDGTPVIG
jgi:hypothetical protein